MIKRHAWLLMGFAFAMPSAAEDKAAPHGLGLLAGRVADDAAASNLRAALANARPEVRAAAVRVINVSGAGPLVPSVRDALGTETDPAVASEMIRFLAALVYPDLDTAVLQAARRLGPPAHAALVDGLARRGAAASVHVAALRELGIHESSWRSFYHLATAAAGSEAGPLGAPILRDRNVTAWRDLLGSVRREKKTLDGGLAVAAVRSESVEIRRATYWHLAREFDPARPAPEALGAALSESPEARAAAPADPEAGLALETLRRVRGETPLPLLETIKAVGESLRSALPHDALEPGGLLRVFDQAERRAIGAILVGREDAFDKWRDAPPKREPQEGPSFPRVRTASGYPVGYVDDVLRATGCAFREFGRAMGGEVVYGADGRPRHVSVLRSGASERCLEASRILLVSALAPLGVATRPEQKSLLLVPDQPEFVQCMDEAARRPWLPPEPLDPRSWTAAGARIQEPEKVRDRPPRYPESAKLRGVQGVVILEANITPSGCVHEVSLLRGLDTSLDLEAIRAVSGWGYSPYLRDGVAVPFVMTVTVNFKLSR